MVARLSCASTRTTGAQPTVCAYMVGILRPCLSMALLSYLPSLDKTKQTRRLSELRRRVGRISLGGFLIAALMGPPPVPTSAVSSNPRSASDICILLSSSSSASRLPTVRSTLASPLDLLYLEPPSVDRSSTAFETRPNGPRSFDKVAPCLARVVSCVSISGARDVSK